MPHCNADLPDIDYDSESARGTAKARASLPHTLSLSPITKIETACSASQLAQQGASVWLFLPVALIFFILARVQERVAFLCHQGCC